MNRSPLLGLPAVCSRAHLAAREQLALIRAMSAHARPHLRPPPAVRQDIAPGRQPVRLLTGHDTQVLLHLLTEAGASGPMRLVWLDACADREGRAPAAPCDLLSQTGHPELLALVTRLYLVRELLDRQGLLVMAAGPDPHGSLPLILKAVFGCEGHWAVATSHESPSQATVHVLDLALAPGGPPVRTACPGLYPLLETHTHPHDAVLLLHGRASMARALSQLDRQWHLSHPDELHLTVLTQEARILCATTAHGARSCQAGTGGPARLSPSAAAAPARHPG